MKKLIVAIAVIAITSCSTIKYIPVETNTNVNVLDSIAWHDSTIYSYITKERIVDVVNYLDTLKLDATYASATAYVDTTTHTLKGDLRQKDSVKIETKIKWKERIEYRDSIVTKEIPVPVEVLKPYTPKWVWSFVVWFILSLVVIGLRIYIKIVLKK